MKKNISPELVATRDLLVEGVMQPTGSRFLEREDSAVRSTNDEATVGKFSAVSKGYYQDRFVDAFLLHAPMAFHPPLMNRGHYARVHSIQRLCERFLAHIEGLPARRQLVSLGCGFDTLCFRLASSAQHNLQALDAFHYFEVDFGQVWWIPLRAGAIV